MEQYKKEDIKINKQQIKHKENKKLARKNINTNKSDSKVYTETNRC